MWRMLNTTHANPAARTENPEKFDYETADDWASSHVLIHDNRGAFYASANLGNWRKLSAPNDDSISDLLREPEINRTSKRRAA